VVLSTKDEPHSSGRLDNPVSPGNGKNIIPYCGIVFLIAKHTAHVNIFLVRNEDAVIYAPTFRSDWIAWTRVISIPTAL
jgi:hypothetical protein